MTETPADVTLDEPEAPEVPVVADDTQRSDVARALITIGLVIGTAGLAIPFGAASPANNNDLTPEEYVLCAAAAIGVVGLLLDFFHPWKTVLWRIGFAEMGIGFLWSASAWFELIQPADATPEWRIGHALIRGGYAFLALSAWRWINVGKTRHE